MFDKILKTTKQSKEEVRKVVMHYINRTGKDIYYFVGQRYERNNQVEFWDANKEMSNKDWFELYGLLNDY